MLQQPPSQPRAGQRLPDTLKEYSVVMVAPVIDALLQTNSSNPAQDGAANGSSGSGEEALEIAAMAKLRDFKVRMSQRYGPYTDVDLQEILNPVDRLQSIVMRSQTRHAANNRQLESFAGGAMLMIEQEQAFMRPVRRLATILHGDDPDWLPGELLGGQSSATDEDSDPLLLECRRVVSEFVNKQAIFIARVQEVRDKVISILAKKRQLLRLLRSQYLDAANDDGNNNNIAAEMSREAVETATVAPVATVVKTGRGTGNGRGRPTKQQQQQQRAAALAAASAAGTITNENVVNGTTATYTTAMYGDTTSQWLTVTEPQMRAFSQ